MNPFEIFSTEETNKVSEIIGTIENRDYIKEKIIKYCISLPNTFEDMPFPEDFESVTMKHKENNKWFALLMNVNNKLYLNVKTEPEYSELLRSSYKYIIPAYHMNKQHWNTIIVDDCTDFELLKELIDGSYNLTKA